MNILILTIILLTIILLFYKFYISPNLKKNEKFEIPKFIKKKYNPKKSLKIPNTIICTNQFNIADKPLMDNINHNININPDYDFLFFNDDDCSHFLKTYFPKEVLKAFHSLVPGAFRSDLFRYCYLYINGGVYIDINKKFIIPLNEIIRFNDEIVLVQDRYDIGIYQAFIAIIPNHILMKNAIDQCIINIKNKRNDLEILEITGPILLQKEFIKLYGYTLDKSKELSINNLIYLKNKPIIIDKNGKEIIHTHSIDKKIFQKLSDKKHYGSMNRQKLFK